MSGAALMRLALRTANRVHPAFVANDWCWGLGYDRAVPSRPEIAAMVFDMLSRLDREGGVSISSGRLTVRCEDWLPVPAYSVSLELGRCYPDTGEVE